MTRAPARSRSSTAFGIEPPAQRPAAEPGKAVLIDQNDGNLRSGGERAAEAEAQIERGGFEVAKCARRPIGKASSTPRAMTRARRGFAEAAQPRDTSAAQSGRRQGTSVRAMTASNSAWLHTRGGTGSRPASSRPPQRAGITTPRPVASLVIRIAAGQDTDLHRRRESLDKPVGRAHRGGADGGIDLKLRRPVDRCHHGAQQSLPERQIRVLALAGGIDRVGANRHPRAGGDRRRPNRRPCAVSALPSPATPPCRRPAPAGRA